VGGAGGRPVSRANDWTPLLDDEPDTATVDEPAADSLMGRDRANGGIRREPGLPGHEAVVPEEPKRDSEIGGFSDDPDDETIVTKEMDRKLHATARQAALDRGDGLGI